MAIKNPFKSPFSYNMIKKAFKLTNVLMIPKSQSTWNIFTKSMAFKTVKLYGF